jgi:hypothetical protein
MSAVGVPSGPRVLDRTRVLILAVAVLATLGSGIVIGRVTAPTVRPAPAASEPIRLVPDDSARVHLQVNRHMNELLAGRRGR